MLVHDYRTLCTPHFTRIGVILSSLLGAICSDMSLTLAVKTRAFSNQTVFPHMPWLLAPEAHAYLQRTLVHRMIITTLGALYFFL